jgi:hypothetical protein
MLYRSSSTALAISLVVYWFCTAAVASSQALFRVPCTISYDGGH